MIGYGLVYGVMIFTVLTAVCLRWFLRRSALTALYKTKDQALLSDNQNTQEASPSTSPLSLVDSLDTTAIPEALDAVDLDTLAWIKGGPMRVMDVWFARLVLSGRVTNTLGRFEKTPKKEQSEDGQPEGRSSSQEDMSFFENQAFTVLPSFGQTTSLRHLWRRSLRRLQIFLIKNSVLLMPEEARFKLYRLLMSCLFLVHFLVLLYVSASFALWTLSLLFWITLLPFLFFMHLKIPVNPYEIARAEAFEEQFEKDPEHLEEKDVLTFVALYGAPSLLGTKWEHAVLAAPMFSFWKWVF